MDKSKYAKKPNIIYILGDDQRYEYLGNMGHPVVKTPNLDYIAREGVLFENAFCTSPACTPSRTCHYLGQWERTHGVNFNSNSSVAPEAWEKSFPMQLKNNGYFLGWIGKNHVPAGIGGYESGYFEEVFDYWYGNHGHSGFYPKERPGGEIYCNAKADTQIEVFEEGALNFLNPKKEFIESCIHPLPARPKDQPFCLCITFNLPHDEGTGTMELRPTDDDLYKNAYRSRIDDLPIPKTYIPYDVIEEPRLPVDLYNGEYIPHYDYVKNLEALKERQVKICQTVTGMDRMIGNILRELDLLGIADNTIIIFSTDHGIHHGEHGLGGKCFLYEEDLRIPMIIYNPLFEEEIRGKRIKQFALVPDLAPTVLEMAGVEVPEQMQGKSLLPVICKENVSWREDFFTEQLMDIQNYPKSESVRNKNWKYIRYFRRTEDPAQQVNKFRGTLDNYNNFLTDSISGKVQPVYEELYNIKEDPYEEVNLANNPAYKNKIYELRLRLLELAIEVQGNENGPVTVPYINNL
jgi:arylsulfatase A-like enzyme